MNKLIGVLVLCCSLFVDKSYGQVTGDCLIPGVDLGAPLQVFTPISDIQRGVLITYSNVSNIIGVQVEEIDESSRFFTVEFDYANSEITIALSPEFDQFEEEIPNQSSNRYDLKIKLFMVCATNAQQMTVMQPVLDTNNHDPIFSQDYYTYSLPMPFPPLELNLLEAITVTDIDFSQTHLTISITTPGVDQEFSIEYGWLEDDDLKKTHTVILKAIKYLELTEPVTFVISASDGEREGTAVVSIIVDEQASKVPLPVFSKISYRAKYTVNENLPDSLDVLEHIRLEANNPADVIVGTPDTHFNVTYYPNEVLVQLQNDLSNEILDYLSYYQVVIKATNVLPKNTPGNITKIIPEVEAVLIIELPLMEQCRQRSLDGN